MNTSGQRVEKIPELLTLIAHELDMKGQHKLMLVSKRSFYSVGRLVWKRIPRLEIIMRLIEDVSVGNEHLSSHPRYERHITVTLPLSPDLSRYTVYSPWVQELEIFGAWGLNINHVSFPSLFDGRPLLPNLQRLTAYTNSSIRMNKLSEFINMFINPSLTETRTIIPKEGLPTHLDSRILSSSVPTFLAMIKETCPQIRVLEFYPESADTINSPGWYIPTEHCRSTLSSFLNLRSFSSCTYILEPVNLGVFGQLPYLESLGIRGSPYEYSVLRKPDRSLSIPEASFPALKDLRLYDIHPIDIAALWNQPAIAKKLVSTLIQTDYSTVTHRFYFTNLALGELAWAFP